MTVHNGRVYALGACFDSLTMEEAIQRCTAWCRTDRRPHVITTLNASLITRMHDDERFREACVSSDLVLADGVPVVWVIRLLGHKLPQRLAGVDLMEALLAKGAREHLRVFFLGAAEDVLRELVRICRDQYPGLTIAGYRNGYFACDEHSAVIDEIRASRPDILFIGMPSPFKEIWSHEHREELGIPVIMGVGGSFDVLAGAISRAPRWMQHIGMEWFWRLCHEPRRLWRRYLVGNTRFILIACFAVLRRWLSR